MDQQKYDNEIAILRDRAARAESERDEARRQVTERDAMLTLANQRVGDMEHAMDTIASTVREAVQKAHERSLATAADPLRTIDRAIS